MSLILNGIDLPEEEETISLMIEPDGTVYFYVWDSTENDKLTSDGRTNAIQIPKGHGRLIDANTKIKAELYDSENGTYIEKEMTIEQWFMFMKNDAPTILEAESEEQNEMPI